MDGEYVAVRFPHAKDALSSTPASTGDDPSSLLQECRILRKVDLMLVKGNQAPRVPDCFQKIPKKITVAENGQILAVSVDNQGKLYTIFYLVE